ncbi:MAG: hypothetical protein HQL94_07820, partial [Magnetococcales bacterium]|nr:hypothetical protein [Magnetococcales bacterium]
MSLLLDTLRKASKPTEPMHVTSLCSESRSESPSFANGLDLFRMAGTSKDSERVVPQVYHHANPGVVSRIGIQTWLPSGVILLFYGVLFVGFALYNT